MALEEKEEEEDEDDEEENGGGRCGSVDASSARRDEGIFQLEEGGKTRTTTFSRVEMTPLSFIPGAVVTKYCGRINLLFIKESWTVRESGGVAKFFHQFSRKRIVSFELIVLRWVQTRCSCIV